MSGIGVCLMQDSALWRTPSRALTLTKANYAQIAKDLLLIVFGVERSS